MPRPLRIHVPGAFYHVTLRGNHRQDIFFCHEHRRWLDDIVAESVQRFGARVHAFVWMTNHVHLLIQVGEVPLGRTMLRIASVYARRVQKHLSTTGHLFERRYHAILVDEDDYLLSLIRYIHLNPWRANMVTTLDDYPWSSHHAYANGVAIPWLTTEFALAMFSRDRELAHQRYRRFIGEELTQRHADKPLEQRNPSDPRVLGCDEFVARIHAIAWRPRSRMTLDQIIEAVSREESVSVVNLASKTASRRFARIRACIAHRCVDGRVATVSEVARKFNRDESTLRESMLRYRHLD